MRGDISDGRQIFRKNMPVKILLFTLFLMALSSCVGKKAKEETVNQETESSTDVQAETSPASTTESAEETEDIEYDSAKINKSDLFTSYPGDGVWKNNENEYMLIPYIKDGKEQIEFRLYGETKFLLEQLSFSQMENGGIKVSGKMQRVKDKSWNADADVIWDSLESIDYPSVRLTNGTEMTDVDMGGDYTYYGLVSSTEQENVGDIRGVYEVEWGEGGAQMTISGRDTYIVNIIANYVIDASTGNVHASEFEGVAVKESGNLYRATGDDGWISFVVNTDGSISVTDQSSDYGDLSFVDTYRKVG